MIKNKTESDYEIKKRGLNRIVEEIFQKGDVKGISRFLEENPYPYYNIRDKSRSRGQFLYKLTKNEVLLQCDNYDKFSVYESLCDADERLVLQGDIFINNKFEIMASLDDRKNIPLRIATNDPKYRISLDLKERREPSIPGLTEMIDYLISHELFNVYVELTMFEIPVGINEEKILVWELRNY